MSMETNQNTTFAPGNFLTELLYTDTIGWEVVSTTPCSITVRGAHRGDVVRHDHIGGNPYPVTYYALSSDTEAPVRTLRRRKDGTFRTVRGGSPLMLADRIDGHAVEKVDYRH